MRVQIRVDGGRVMDVVEAVFRKSCAPGRQQELCGLRACCLARPCVWTTACKCVGAQTATSGPAT
eukprot:6102070-Pleurochrysis_carterae.AAC.1